MIKKTSIAALLLSCGLVSCAQNLPQYKAEGNPIFSHKFTCDPAAMVEGKTLTCDLGGNATTREVGDAIIEILK